MFQEAVGSTNRCLPKKTVMEATDETKNIVTKESGRHEVIN